MAMQGVIMTPVFELFADAAADLEMVVGSHGHIAGVKEAVDIAAQQQAILRLVRAAFGIGPDVCGFERRQGPLARDGTLATIDIGDKYAERALTQARA